MLFALQSLLSVTLQTFVFKTNEGYFGNPPFISGIFGYNSYYGSRPVLTDQYMQDSAAKYEEIINALKEKDNLTEEQSAYVNRWIADYKIWEQDQANYKKGLINSVSANIISILIFGPVFFYHFKIARRRD